MKALITGASGGLGLVMAQRLGGMGYELILVARSKDKLEEIKNALGEKTEIHALDLSDINNCYTLYEMVKGENIDILINNAGFGVYGEFCETDISAELNMLDLNIKALHVLTKLFLRDFVAADNGYILNVASLAAFMPGPMHAGYYASKAYVLRLTQAIYEELRRKKSNVYIGAFCPGPVKTGFNARAGAGFAVRGMDCDTAAAYAINKMFRRKLIIMPDFVLRAICFFQRFIPAKLMLKLTYNLQMKRTVEKHGGK